MLKLLKILSEVINSNSDLINNKLTGIEYYGFSAKLFVTGKFNYDIIKNKLQDDAKELYNKEVTGFLCRRNYAENKTNIITQRMGCNRPLELHGYTTYEANISNITQDMKIYIALYQLNVLNLEVIIVTDKNGIQYITHKIQLKEELSTDGENLYSIDKGVLMKLENLIECKLVEFKHDSKNKKELLEIIKV